MCFCIPKPAGVCVYLSECVFEFLSMCVCVCEKERERKREREKKMGVGGCSKTNGLTGFWHQVKHP